MNQEVTALSQTLGTVTAGPMMKLGDTFQFSGGRRFKYTGFANTSAIVAGAHVYAVVTTSAALALTTVANGQLPANLIAGSTQLTIVSAGSVTQNAYVGGFVLITNGSDKYSLRIASNTGVTGAGNFTIQLEDALCNSVALVPGTATATLSTSPDVASTTTSTSNIDCGYAVCALPALTSGTVTYGYTQVAGYNAISASLTNIE
jgi:hypothetical protein